MQDIDQRDRELLGALQGEIPLVSTPFAVLGQMIDMSEKEVIKRTERLKRDGLIKQIAAPVNDPRSWPKSSDSRSVSASEPPSTATKGPALLALLAWIARAISSFPVPLSPCSNTVLSVFATRAIDLYTDTIPGLLPTRLSNRYRCFSCSLSA